MTSGNDKKRGKKRTARNEGNLCMVSMRLLLFSEGRALCAHLRLFWSEIGINANIVVGKLSHLGIIDTDNLCLFSGAQTKAGDKVHDPEDEGGHDERVAETGAAVCELVAELDPVVVDPATVDDGEAVESGNLLLGKEGGEDVTDHTTDTVRGKDIERVIIVEDKLELCGKVAHGTGDDTKCDRGGWTDETRSGCDGNETDDATRAETDNGPFTLETVIPEHPGETGNGSGEVGDDACIGGTHVCREC